MEPVWKISDELAIAGPVALEQLQPLAEDGFKSVLNLHSIDPYRLPKERESVERLGLRYVNLPLDYEPMSPELADTALRQIDVLPKPALVYCNNVMLAAATVLMHIAVRQGATLQQAFEQAEQLGLFKIYAAASPSPLITYS